MGNQPAPATANQPSTPSLHPSAVLVIKVHPVLPAQKELPVMMVMMELLENPDMMEKTPSSCPPKRPSHASSAQLDLPDPTELWEPKDHPDQKEPPASPHAMEFPAILAWLDNPDPWADQAEKVLAEPPVLPADSSQFPDLKDHPDLPDRPASKDPRDNPVPTVNPSKARPAKPASQAPLEKKDAPDPLALPVHKEMLAKKEVATTAQNHGPHQAIKRDSPTERSGFRNFGHGTLTIFCFIFTTG